VRSLGTFFFMTLSRVACMFGATILLRSFLATFASKVEMGEARLFRPGGSPSISIYKSKKRAFFILSISLKGHSPKTLVDPYTVKKGNNFPVPSRDVNIHLQEVKRAFFILSGFF
jgi:hypothetical protein